MLKTRQKRLVVGSAILAAVSLSVATPAWSKGFQKRDLFFSLHSIITYGVSFRLEKTAEVRVGKQVLSWGESTFFQNGINVINPVDVSALRVPGAELRDALLPESMVAASVSPTETLTVEGFYLLNWDNTKIDPPGSLFSFSDIAGEERSCCSVSEAFRIAYLPGTGLGAPIGVAVPRAHRASPYFARSNLAPVYGISKKEVISA